MEKHVQELFRLDGKVAIVTGGSKYLGFDIAQALGEMGASVIITSREPAKAARAAEVLKTEHAIEAMALQLDHCQWPSVEKMARDAFDWKGHIDILVNNAGGGSGVGECNLFKRDPRHIHDLIQSNLVGPLYCCKAVGGFMMEQKSGRIINIASVAGHVGRDRRMYHTNNKMEQPIEYAAAKMGVVGMTRDLAGLMAPAGVCVNCISPGGFDKGDLSEGFLRDYSNATMLGRMGRMGVDLKGAALFLASAASDYVTGCDLVVDGGFSVWK